MSRIYDVTVRKKIEFEYVVRVEAEDAVDACLNAEENDADGNYNDKTYEAIRALIDGGLEFEVDEVSAFDPHLVADEETDDVA